VINLGEEIYLALEVVESSNLEFFDGFDCEELLGFAVHAFTDAAVVAFAQNGGEDVVVGEDVGVMTCDGAYVFDGVIII